VKKDSGAASGAGAFHTIHLYGEYAVDVTRLAIWHPTLDEEHSGAYFDWGDVPRGTTSTRQFRVKNLDDALTANSVGVTVEALTDTTPSVPGQHSLSADGSTFLPSLNIGALGPGEVSDVLHVMRTTPADADMGLWALRIVALAGSWS
jgi:hypothetical protein